MLAQLKFSHATSDAPKATIDIEKVLGPGWKLHRYPKYSKYGLVVPPYDATTDADIDEFMCFNQDDDAVYVAPDGATFLSFGAAHVYAGEKSPLSRSMQSASQVPKIMEESKGTDIPELHSSLLDAIQSDDIVEEMLMQRYESIEYIQKPQIKKAREDRLQAKLDDIIEQASAAFFETSTVKVLEIADDDWLQPAGPNHKGRTCGSIRLRLPGLNSMHASVRTAKNTKMPGTDDATRLSTEEVSVATVLKSLRSKSKSKSKSKSLSKTCDSNSKHILPRINPQSEPSEMSASKTKPQHKALLKDKQSAVGQTCMDTNGDIETKREDMLDKIKQRKRKAPLLYGNLLSTEDLADFPYFARLGVNARAKSSESSESSPSRGPLQKKPRKEGTSRKCRPSKQDIAAATVLQGLKGNMMRTWADYQSVRKGAEDRADRVTRFVLAIEDLEKSKAVTVERASEREKEQRKMAVDIKGFAVTSAEDFAVCMNNALRLPQDKPENQRLCSGVRETLRYLALLPKKLSEDGRYDWTCTEFAFNDKVRVERLQRAILNGHGRDPRGKISRRQSCPGLKKPRFKMQLEPSKQKKAGQAQVGVVAQPCSVPAKDMDAAKTRPKKDANARVGKIKQIPVSAAIVTAYCPPGGTDSTPVTLPSETGCEPTEGSKTTKKKPKCAPGGAPKPIVLGSDDRVMDARKTQPASCKMQAFKPYENFDMPARRTCPSCGRHFQWIPAFTVHAKACQTKHKQ